MIRLYPEQLAAQLHEGLRSCYLLFGNEPLLLEESQDAIRRAASAQQFSESFSYELTAQTDWENIFTECQSLSLFSSRKIFILHFPENGANAAIGEQLTQLGALINPDILLILRGPKLTKGQENSGWFKALGEHGVYVSCLTPEQAHLPRWVAQRAKSIKLSIDDAAIQLLCYCYEGNLLALAQALERLSLLYPDGKLTLPRVEQAVSDAAHFTPYHWIDAILSGKTKRAFHILHQLRLEDTESLILIRTLQRELLQLLHLHRKMQHTPLRTLFDQQKIWQNRRPLLTQTLQRLTAAQLTQAVALLTQLELTVKQDFGQSIWDGLESLMMLLCGKPLSEAR
ncbi:DNA polymerase III subunit delta [Pragia fontium]|uniref:DNA polymerase III subunit delta n=1 Tax=Pragia fontium DSM 5563 = ATCC 49100 TaxID=1122977 RepID=A0AAJ4W8X2_9GAMM|nr:DNA polymerase III subunit delta [Pragia fontium]AKJ41866.1 DNA polymerase III subunit delta [Pragia fontium]SFC38256.1 DNA polymerase III, delta subunit [Pragia fontium DSM 5563 = ATCC 49100]SUB82089.1 DNA polymerase III subunit delta [Pragia fontium]